MPVNAQGIAAQILCTEYIAGTRYRKCYHGIFFTVVDKHPCLAWLAVFAASCIEVGTMFCRSLA